MFTDLEVFTVILISPGFSVTLAARDRKISVIGTVSAYNAHPHIIRGYAVKMRF